MCALAHILKNQNYIVMGSDIDKSQIKCLKKDGFDVYLGHKASHINSSIDLVVYSSSIATSNPELVKAKKLGIHTINRGELLAEIVKDYKNVISISGSHGKTTTTSMIFEIFKNANLNPTAHIGGIIRSINSNYYLGGNDYFITEACEFRDNFLFMKSNLAVITNIEPEHMDYFKTKKNLHNSFQKFADNSIFVVTSEKINHNNKIKIGKNGFHSENEFLCDDGCYSFDCKYKNKFLFNAKLKVIGKYNIQNAIFAVAVAVHFNIDYKIIKYSLQNYMGVERRFDILNTNPSIIHDYAHHPSELRAVIDATKSWTLGKLIVVFQPHTYSRTASLMKDFNDSFKCCDRLIILKTYSARENEIIGGRAIDLYNNLYPDFKNKIIYFEDFSSCQKYLKFITKKQDRILFLGAGNIIDLAKNFTKEYSPTKNQNNK